MFQISSSVARTDSLLFHDIFLNQNLVPETPDLGAPPEPILYVPLAQNTWSTVTYLTVRTRGNATGLTAAIREHETSAPKPELTQVLICREGVPAGR